MLSADQVPVKTDRLHLWLLRIVGASTAPTSMALTCRWRSRPQHQKQTYAVQQIQLNAAMISLTSGFMWKLLDGAMLTRPPASSIARATTGPTAAIFVRSSPCRSVSSD